MKKVFVSTYCNSDSYGAALQAYALQSFVTSLCYDCILINDKIKGTVRYKKNIKSVVRNIIKVAFARKLRLRHTRGEKFIKDNIKTTMPITSFEEAKMYKYDTNLFIAGSDQIWNPDLCRGMFFLRFLDDSCKKISYAASMGKTQILENKYDKFKQYVSDFDYISVREESNKSVIEKFATKAINVNIDPTLLHDKERYVELEKEYRIRGEYVLVFPIYWDSKYNAQLKEIHKRTGLKIVALSASLNVYCNKRAVDAGVAEFLYLVRNAKYIITSSFHGTVFSMIYKKPFYSVVNPALPSRITDLLDKVGLASRNVTNITELNFDIDYSSFDTTLKMERNNSRKYLLESLGGNNENN